MKKAFPFALAFLCLAAAFFTGYWIKSQQAVTAGTPTESLLPPAAGEGLGETGSTDALFPLPGAIQVSTEKRQLMGMKTDVAEKKPGQWTLRLLGRVAVDENRLYVINATIDGWITEVQPIVTGTFVRKNQTLGSFYSPEFLSAQQAMLFALANSDRVRTTGKETTVQKDQLTQFNINLQQYKDSLRNLGMGGQQIEELVRDRRYMENIRITAPTDGVVTVRNISMGLRFNKGADLFKIADLSRVWVLAEAYENEEQDIPPGRVAKIIVPQLGKTLEGKVSKTLPLFDTATRTLKVRLEAANPGFVLKPDMFVDVEIPVAYPPTITVPVDAVLDSGMRKTIFIDRGDGYFQPREVETGRRFGERVEIAKGLNEGERYVVSGNFLLDSESRMKLGATGVYGTLARDAVCGKDVSVRKADREGRKSVHGGKTFYFSSMACKQQFDGDPARYAGAGEGKQDVSTGGSAR